MSFTATGASQSSWSGANPCPALQRGLGRCCRVVGREPTENTSMQDTGGGGLGACLTALGENKDLPRGSSPPLAFLRLRLVQNHEQRPSLLRVPFSHPHQPGPASERSRTGLGLPHHWSLPPHNPMQIMDFPCLSAKGSCVVNRTRGQAEGPAAG